MERCCLFLAIPHSRANMRTNSSMQEQIVVVPGYQGCLGKLAPLPPQTLKCVTGVLSLLSIVGNHAYLEKLRESTSPLEKRDCPRSQPAPCLANSNKLLGSHLDTFACRPFHTLKCYLLVIRDNIFHDTEVSLFYIHRILNIKSYIFIPELVLFFFLSR